MRISRQQEVGLTVCDKLTTATAVMCEDSASRAVPAEVSCLTLTRVWHPKSEYDGWSFKKIHLHTRLKSMLPPSAASEAAPAPGVQGTARAGNTDGGVGAEQLEELRARLEQIPEMQRQLNELRSEQGKQVRSARSCE